MFLQLALSAVEPAHLLSFEDVAAAMAASAERQRAATQQAMAPSLERQRQSIRTQGKSAVEQGVSADAFFTIPWPKPPEPVTADCDPLPASQVEALITENARSQSLEPKLLREVMRKESGFRPCAVSRSGAQGLMQLMPATAEELHVADAFDPKQNVAGGARYLKTLLDKYSGNVALALSAYNAGPNRTDEAGGVPAVAETRNYVLTILGALAFH